MRIVHGIVLALAAVGAACSEPPPAPVYRALPIERRDIVVSAEAAGSIEPRLTLEVKSKASGEILELMVETGDRVERGTLMLRIDRRQPRNALAEAEAELEVARAGLANAESQLQRAQKLFDANSLSQTDYDRAVLDRATATAEVVRAKVAVENARILLEDTNVKAPITGTVIEKTVERGQVISSPTQDVAGGTPLLMMADLTVVQARTLVDETDIGKIRPGLRATVVAAAYPDEPFEGEVLKIEPQAVTEQNVTMFPVLVSVENRDDLLKPGMNCEVEIHVGIRKDVLTVPNAALRTPKDLSSAAGVLGLTDEDLEERLGAERIDGDAAPPGVARYFVFAVRDGEPVPVRIDTGLTDLDHAELLSGLVEGDEVLVLPSAGLVNAQELFRKRLDRITGGGLPGVRRSKGSQR